MALESVNLFYGDVHIFQIKINSLTFGKGPFYLVILRDLMVRWILLRVQNKIPVLKL